MKKDTSNAPIVKRVIIGGKHYVVARRKDGTYFDRIKYNPKKRMNEYRSDFKKNKTFAKVTESHVLTNVIEYQLETTKRPKTHAYQYWIKIRYTYEGQNHTINARSKMHYRGEGFTNAEIIEETERNLFQNVAFEQFNTGKDRPNATYKRGSDPKKGKEFIDKMKDVIRQEGWVYYKGIKESWRS